MDYSGVIIEESLENKDLLNRVKIIETKIEPVTERHQTPWLRQWTLHTVEIPEGRAEEVAAEISRSIDRKHKGSWYADYQNDRWHYIVFRERVFRVRRGDRETYSHVKDYGVSVGIPEYQVDFAPT